MIKGPDGRIIKATVVPRDDGTYEIFCAPPKKGIYQVQLLENAELVCFPFFFVVCVCCV